VELVRQARKAVAHATGLQELRAAQAVLAPAVTGATLTMTAALLRLAAEHERRRSLTAWP